MFDIHRLAAAHHQPEAMVRRPATAYAAAPGGLILPVLLLVVLAVAAVGLSPATAQLCAKLEDFPCGP